MVIAYLQISYMAMQINTAGVSSRSIAKMVLRKENCTNGYVSAAGEFDTAIILTEEYLKQLRQERRNAEEAIKIVKQPFVRRCAGKLTQSETERRIKST